LEAHLALGLYTIYLGEFPASRQHFETGLSLYDPGPATFASFNYLGHSAAICHSYLGRALSFMGHYDRALTCSEQGLALADHLAIPMSRVQAMGMHTNLHVTRREIGEAREWAARTHAYAVEHGFPYWSSLSSMYTAWLAAQQDDLDAGIALLREGLARYTATGAKLGLSSFLVMLAELYAIGGRWAEGLDALDLAAAHVDRTGERYYEAEVERLKGELRRGEGGPSAGALAEAHFQKALAIAGAQRAHSWSLRAATSLARLWRDEHRIDEARRLLSDVHGWFTEGFDVPDLRASRALLDELAT
jgi:predicted ATPase